MYKKILFLSIILTLLFSNIATAQTTQYLTLKPGFNFLSFTRLITSSPAELKGANPSIDDIYLFSPSAGSFLSLSDGTLTSLSAGKGYIIKNNSLSDALLTITGNDISSANSISLKTGFNLVGFSQAPTSFTFEKLMTANTIIKGCYKWSPMAGTFIQVIKSDSGVITKIDGVDPTIKAGESYFINMYADSNLTYDASSILLTPSSYGTISATQVANPIITPNGGTFSSTQQITITCSTEGAEIYYNIDDGTQVKYTAPFFINKGCSIKANASKLGMNNSDVVTSVFVMSSNPELEIAGSLPSNALNSPKSSINFGPSIGTKGNSIMLVRADSENTEIGTITVNATNYIAYIPINETSYTALIIIKDSLGRILYRNLLGKTLIKSEIPALTSKIKISGINIDSTSTAMALLVKEKNIELNKITSVASTDLQNGIAIKTSNIPNEISQNFSSTPNLITEVAKAVNTVNTTVLSTSVSTNTVPISISTATQLLSSFIKVTQVSHLKIEPDSLKIQ